MASNWMLYEQLTRRLLDAGRNASGIPFRAVKFRDGTAPLAGQCHQNVTRWISENRGSRRVPGWLITSGTIFDKHSIVLDTNRKLFDITPLNCPTPFVPHPGDMHEFDGIVGSQYNLTIAATHHGCPGQARA